MKYTKKQIQNLLGAMCVIVFVFLAGLYIGYNNKPWVERVAGIENRNTPTEIRSNADFEPFWKVWSIINSKYPNPEETSNQDKVWGAIEGLTSSLNDPYTEFFPPQESKQFMEQINGEFSGVGMEVGMKDNILTVIAPLKNSPADRAGIRPGDKILKIDSKVTTDMKVNEAVKLIKGKPGTKITLTLYRQGEDQPFDVTLVREVITIPTIESISRNDGIQILNIYNFGSGVTDEFKKEIVDFNNSGKNKLIIDLRNNPGGFLDAAVEIASYFLPQGDIIVKEDYGSNREQDIYRSRGYNSVAKDVKIVILVDGGSASASEILAGALSEHKLAILIGEQTYGKGSVQELVPVTDDTSLKITVAKWLTPNGISISLKGLAPDIKVSITKEDIENKKDPQLDRAISYLLTGK